MRIGLITACLTLLCQSAWASQTPLDHIVRTVRNSLEPLTQNHARTLAASRYNIAIQRPDDRLRLPACSAPLQVEDPPLAPIGRIHIKVSCEGRHDWSLYVTTEISYWLPVVVTNKRIQRGSILSSADLNTAEWDVSQLRAGYLTEPSAASGQRLRRTLAAGTALNQRQLEIMPVISRGDQVEIQVKSGALLVRAEGEALSDGRINQQIRVRNSKSERIVSAIVKAPNLVQVGFTQ